MLFEHDMEIPSSADYVVDAPLASNLHRVRLELSPEEGSYPVSNSTVVISDEDMDGIQTDIGLEEPTVLVTEHDLADFMFGSLDGAPIDIEGFGLTEEGPGLSMDMMTGKEEDLPADLPWSYLGIEERHEQTPEGNFSTNLLGDGFDSAYSFMSQPVEQYLPLPCFHGINVETCQECLDKSVREWTRRTDSTPRGGQTDEEGKSKKRAKVPRRHYRGGEEWYPYPPRSNNRSPGFGPGEASLMVPRGASEQTPRARFWS